MGFSWWDKFKLSVNRHPLATQVASGVINAHLPEFVSVGTVYWLFRGKDYALELAMYQMVTPAITTTLVGLVVPLLQSAFDERAGTGASHQSEVQREANRLAQIQVNKMRNSRKGSKK